MKRSWWVGMLSIWLSISAPSGAFARDGTAAADLRVHLLGTGSPIPLTKRFGPSILVEAGRQKFLFDAGRGAVQRIFSLGIPFQGVDKLFLTHLHSDHTVGIPDMWLTGWIRGRATPFKVWGPTGTETMMQYMVRAFDYDIRIRLTQNEGSKVETTEISEGPVYDQDGVRITAFKVDHGPVEPAFGFRVDYGGRSVVLSGDTKYSEALVRHAKGVDLLVHEVAAASEERMRTSAAVRGIVAIHTEPEAAGKVFSETRPRLAVYSHIVLFDVSEPELEARTRKTYSGPLVIGEDLMTFDVGETVTFTRTQADR